MTNRTRTARPAPMRGTPEWQAAYFTPAEGVNVRAQVGLALGVEVAIDTSGLEPDGGQLDMFGGAL